MAVRTWYKWLLGHLAVRKIARRGQMPVVTFIMAFLTICRGFRAF